MTTVAGAATLVEPASFTVNVDGSTTVFPITSAAAPTFQTNVGDTTVTFVSGANQPGSSTGITELCNTTTTSTTPNILDIADSSRTYNPPPGGTDCTNLQPWPIAHDGIIPIVNNSNTLGGLNNNTPAGLTQTQLANIWDCTWTDWNQVPGSGVISPASQPIVLISRENTSGTYASFISLVGNGLTTANYCGLNGAANHIQETSNGAVQSAVNTTPWATGYVGLGFETGTNLVDLAVNGVHGGSTTILNNSFPLSRLLWMMTQKFTGNPRIATYSRGIDFINFILSSSGQTFVTGAGEIALLAPQVIPDWDPTLQFKADINSLVDIGQNWQRSNSGHPHWIREDVNHASVVDINSIITVGGHWQGTWSVWTG
jgi:phosphate transport system substrate-binding protein